MKIEKKDLTLESGLKKEWLVTNGIGGYSSSTIIGANTRKYHGLLVVPFSPPARRYLILSKVDESIIINKKTHNLYTNLCKDYISDGYKYQEEFEKEYVPIFTYKIGDVKIKKVISMQYGRNEVVVLYEIENGKNDIKFNITPIINYRDFHSMSTNVVFEGKQEIKDNKVKININNHLQHPIYTFCSDGTYKEYVNNNFNNMYYVEEEKRGFYPEENHYVSGTYTIEIKAKQSKKISFVCSMEENIEEINAKKIIFNEVKRLKQLINKTELLQAEPENKKDIEKNELIKKLIIATDNFIVYRPNFGLHTIIAGYPWFLDWGRDALISFEGLLLCTKQYDIAREVLLTFTRDIKFGLVPNGYSGFDNRPLYNSADASLLLFEQINKFLRYTNDYDFVEKFLFKKLKTTISSYEKGIEFDDNNIYLDKEDSLLSSRNSKDSKHMDGCKIW